MNTKDVIEMANKAIKTWGITDEDEKQELYLNALSTPGLGYSDVNASLEKTFRKILSNRKRESLLYSLATVSSVKVSFTNIPLEHDCCRNLMKLLETLDEDEKDIIMLIYFNDYSISDISSITYLPENKINEIKKSAIEKLRRSPFLDIVKDYYPAIH